MKTIAPHKNGNGNGKSHGHSNGHGNGNGHAKPKAGAVTVTTTKTTTMTKGLDPSVAAALLGAEPRYDTGLRYDTPGLRYASADPLAVPVNDGGRVKLDLSRKTDTDLVNFTYAHIEDMTDNANFPAPQPPAVDFKALADAFANAVTAKKSAENIAKQATAAKDEARLVLEQAFGVVRAPYVQITSNGNTDVILSSGLPVRSAPTPTGDLPPPTGLLLDLNGTPGVMLLRWNVVAKARGYVIEVSPADTMERVWTTLATVNNAKPYTVSNLVLGKMYAFRVAANGGTSGQSFWSAEVSRMAA